jgi:hypothetical protein
MWKWFAALACTIGLLSSPALAETGARAFQKVPVTHWGYEAIQLLEQYEHFTGAPRETFSGAIAVTRYEFATATERIYGSIQSRVLAATRPGTLPQELEKFERLLDEFGEDLALLGPDVEEMRRELAAMSQRVARLQNTFEPRRASVGDSEPAPVQPLAGERSLDQPSFPELAPNPIGGSIKGLGTSIGDATLQLNLRGPDPFDTLTKLPLTTPFEGGAIQARFSLPIGQHLVSAFYDREGGHSDRYGLWTPYLTPGPVEGIGARIDGPITSKLGFNVEGASLRPLETDFSQMFYLRTGLKYKMGAVSLALGYEWFRQLGAPGMNFDGGAYTVGIGRSFGQRARLDVFYRWFDGPDSLGGRDVGNAGAITQFSVRF